jgi:hypothetical protein
MELQEILDLLNGKKRLSQMAFPLKQIYSHLMDKALHTNRYTNLILIYYFRDQQEADHWIDELSGFIPISPIIKGRNQRLDEKNTFHYIWKGFAEDYSPEEFHEMYFKNAFYEEERKKQNIENKIEQKVLTLSWSSVKQNPKDAYSFMEEFHKEIAKKLAKDGEIFIPETRKIILSKFTTYRISY